MTSKGIFNKSSGKGGKCCSSTKKKKVIPDRLSRGGRAKDAGKTRENVKQKSGRRLEEKTKEDHKKQLGSPPPDLTEKESGRGSKNQAKPEESFLGIKSITQGALPQGMEKERGSYKRLTEMRVERRKGHKVRRASLLLEGDVAKKGEKCRRTSSAGTRIETGVSEVCFM